MFATIKKIEDVKIKENLLLNVVCQTNIIENKKINIKFNCKYCNKIFNFKHNKLEHELVWHQL